MLIDVVVRMHQALYSINSIIMSKDSIYCSSSIALAFNKLSRLSWDKVLEELSNLHILSDIRGSVTKLVLQKRISISFLDQIYDAFKVSVFTRIMQWSIFIEISDISVSRWLVTGLKYQPHYISVPPDRCQM